jgi:hypothetical protein
MNLAIQKSRIASLLILVVGFLLWTSGCTHQSPNRADRATLTGSVSYQGKPLPGGSVAGVSTQDPLIGCSGIIGSDGTFGIQNAPFGPMKIAVNTEALKMVDSTRYVPIPAKYTDPETSGITADIKANEANTIEIKLE